MAIEMFGPSFDGSGQLVNRDVSELDVVAYERAGYKVGRVPEAPKTKAVTVSTNDTSLPIPDDFPGYAALKEAGITSFAELRDVEDLTEIEGIGRATAEKIAAALAES